MPSLVKILICVMSHNSVPLPPAGKMILRMYRSDECKFPAATTCCICRSSFLITSGIEPHLAFEDPVDANSVGDHERNANDRHQN